MAALVCLCGCLSGCTSWGEYVRNGFKVGPNYCQPEAEVADAWIDAGDPTVSSEPADLAAWWRTFHDPVLNQLVYAAYRQNLTLRVAGLRILEARAMRGIAVGDLFPQSQAAFGEFMRKGQSANTAYVPPVRFFDEWKTGANLAWELDFWGRFRRGIESADANLDASIENYNDVLVLLLSEVAQTYTDLRTAEQRLVYAANNVVIQRGSLDLAKKRFTEGAADKLDVTQTQSNLSQTQATIPPLEAARRQAANQLCILLGMPPGNLEETLKSPELDRAIKEMQDVLAMPEMTAGQVIPAQTAEAIIPTAPARVAVGIPAELLRRRPDVGRAEREAAAQSARIGIATSDLYPHFSILGSLYFDAEDFKHLFDGNSLAGNVGPSFRWDVLHYGRLRNNIRVQDARFQQLVLQYQNIVLQANAEAENALVAFLKAKGQVKYLHECTEAASQSVDLVKLQFKWGRIDFNRVFTIQQLLTQKQDQLAVAQGTVTGQLIQLYKALGGGWEIGQGGSESGLAGPAAQSDELLPAPVPVEAKPPPAPLPPPLPLPKP